jgi:cold-inducible RNA-binding protein
MRIYVGNLSFDSTEDELKKEFEAYGKVESVTIIKDERTGRSKGFGFVEMPANGEAEAAILALNGQTVRDRKLTVNEARPRTESGSGGYRWGGGNKGGGGGGRSERRY